MKPRMPNMQELLKQISNQRKKMQNEPVWISKLDLENAYGQLKISKETSKLCNFAMLGRNMNGYYRYKIEV